MEAEVSLRKQLDDLPESSRYNSAEFYALPAAPVETPSPAKARISLRVACRDANDPPQVSEHTGADEDDPPELSQHDQRSFESGRKLITGIQAGIVWGQNFISGFQAGFRRNRKLVTGIAIVLAVGVSALTYFFSAPTGKTITQTADLAKPPYIPATPAETAPAAPPALDTPAATPTTAAPSAVAATPSAPPAAAPAPVPVFAKVAQGGDMLYLQRPGVNIRSTPSPTGRPVATAPKGTRFKVTNRQGDWIQVESGRLKGWINAAFLAPSEAR